MAETKHGICVKENLSGTHNGVDLVSVRYMVDTTATAIDNGNVVLVGAFESNSREVRKATAPAKSSAKADIALIATSEVIYDERLQGDLANFVNEAGAVANAYRLEKPHQIFAVTSEALDGGAARIVGAVVELQAGTKLLAVESNTSGSTKIGSIVDVYTKRGVTYFAIETC